MSAGKPFSWSEIEWMRWCSRKRRSSTYIAQTLGRPLGSVRQKLWRLGIPTYQEIHLGGAPKGNRNGAVSWFQTSDGDGLRHGRRAA